MSTMKLILTLTCESEEEEREAQEYLASLSAAIRRRQNQGMPGACLSRADASIWVSAATLIS